METIKEFWAKVNDFLIDEIDIIHDNKTSFLIYVIECQPIDNILSIYFSGAYLNVFVIDENNVPMKYNIPMIKYLKWRININK